MTTENKAYEFQKDIFYEYLLGKINNSIISKLDKAYKGGFLDYVAKEQGFESLEDAKAFIRFVKATRAVDRTLSKFPPDIREYLLKVLQD